MNNRIYCRTLKLSWNEVASIIANYIGHMLRRKVDGTADYEDGDYWGFCAKGDRFTVSEIKYLVSHVKGNAEMRREAIPCDSESSHSIGMHLSRAILERALKKSWSHESTSSSALWLINVREHKTVAYRRVIEVGPYTIALDELKSKDYIMTYSRENGPTHSVLMDFCEEYRDKYYNKLCWSYPISDGKHLGTFFLLVKEGGTELAV